MVKKACSKLCNSLKEDQKNRRQQLWRVWDGRQAFVLDLQSKRTSRGTAMITTRFLIEDGLEMSDNWRETKYWANELPKQRALNCRTAILFRARTYLRKALSRRQKERNKKEARSRWRTYLVRLTEFFIERL
jgi:hypothetical protein